MKINHDEDNLKCRCKDCRKNRNNIYKRVTDPKFAIEPLGLPKKKNGFDFWSNLK